jgi:hypothetical protein
MDDGAGWAEAHLNLCIIVCLEIIAQVHQFSTVDASAQLRLPCTNFKTIKKK